MTRILSKKKRRVAVMLNYISYVILIFFFSNLLDNYQFIEIAGLGILAILLVGTFIYLYVNINLWNLGNAPDNDLGESQIKVRNESYRYSYIVIATLLLLGVICMAIAFDAGLWFPSTYEEGNAIVWGAILLTMTLPSAIIAWNEKEI